MPSSGGSRPTGPASTAELDAWFDRQMADAAIPGAAMVVVRDGQVVDVHSYGVADDSGSPITPSTPFMIGSLTKSMTALAVMQLVEAGPVGRLPPDDGISAWSATKTRTATTATGFASRRIAGVGGGVGAAISAIDSARSRSPAADGSP